MANRYNDRRVNSSYYVPDASPWQSTYAGLPLDQISQSVMSRQNRYDEMTKQIAMERASENALLSYDPNAKDEFLQRMEEGFGNVYDKYRGDLSLAGKDVYNYIADIQKDPYLGVNKMYTEAYKAQEELSRKLKAEGKELAFSTLPHTYKKFNAKTGKYDWLSKEDMQFDLEQQLPYDEKALTIAKNTLFDESWVGAFPEMANTGQYKMWLNGQGVYPKQVKEKVEEDTQLFLKSNEGTQYKRALMAGIIDVPDGYDEFQGKKVSAEKADEMAKKFMEDTMRTQLRKSTAGQPIYDRTLPQGLGGGGGGFDYVNLPTDWTSIDQPGTTTRTEIVDKVKQELKGAEGLFNVNGQFNMQPDKNGNLAIPSQVFKDNPNAKGTFDRVTNAIKNNPYVKESIKNGSQTPMDIYRSLLLDDAEDAFIQTADYQLKNSGYQFDNTAYWDKQKLLTTRNATLNGKPLQAFDVESSEGKRMVGQRPTLTLNPDEVDQPMARLRDKTDTAWYSPVSEKDDRYEFQLTESSRRIVQPAFDLNKAFLDIKRDNSPYKEIKIEGTGNSYYVLNTVMGRQVLVGNSGLKVDNPDEFYLDAVDVYNNDVRSGRRSYQVIPTTREAEVTNCLDALSAFGDVNPTDERFNNSKEARITKVTKILNMATYLLTPEQQQWRYMVTQNGTLSKEQVISNYANGADNTPDIPEVTE